MDVTSQSWAVAPAATPQRSALPSWARRSRASRRSPSSAAPACASAASRRRPGCRPRISCTRRNETFAKLGVTSGAAARLRRGERVEDRRRQADDQGVAGLFKANGVEWVKGTGKFKAPTRSRSKAARTSPSSRRSSRRARSRCVRRSRASSRTCASTRPGSSRRRRCRSGSSSSAAASSAPSSPRSSTASAPR